MSFRKLAYMADHNMDIALSTLDQIVEVKTARGGGHVIIGVPHSVVMDFLKGKEYVGGLVLASRKQYNTIRDEDLETAVLHDRVRALESALADAIRMIESAASNRRLDGECGDENDRDETTLIAGIYDREAARLRDVLGAEHIREEGR